MKSWIIDRHLICYVIKAHKPDNSEPFKCRKGDEVEIVVGTPPLYGDKRICCVNSNGQRGWMPGKHFIRRIGGNKAEILRDYDSTEFSVDVGEELIIIWETSGWILCGKNRQRGWIPKNKIKKFK